jgi:type IV secretory pathway protease TraF
MNGRFSTLAAMLGGIAVLVAPVVAEPVPLYVWNVSESVPLGLYRLRPADKLFVTELVAAATGAAGDLS